MVFLVRTNAHIPLGSKNSYIFRCENVFYDENMIKLFSNEFTLYKADLADF